MSRSIKLLLVVGYVIVCGLVTSSLIMEDRRSVWTFGTPPPTRQEQPQGMRWGTQGILWTGMFFGGIFLLGWALKSEDKNKNRN